MNFRRPSAGIVLDYLNCNSNGRGVQVVSARAAAQKMKLDNDTFENTVKSRFFRMTDKQVLY